MRGRALIAALVLVAVGGCGGNGSDDSAEVAGVSSTAPTTAPPSSTTTTTVVRVTGFEPAVEIDADQEGTDPIRAASALDVSANGTIAIGSESGVLRVADDAGTLLYLDEEGLHDEVITSVAFISTTDDVVTASEDGTARRWTRTGNDWVAGESFEPADGRDIQAAAVSPDGTTLAVGADDLVHLWDLDKEQAVDAWDPEDYELDAAVQSLAFSPDWQTGTTGTIAAGTAGGSAYLVTQDGPGTGTAVAGGPVTSVAFTEDGSVAAGGGDQVWLISESGGGAPLEGSPASSGPVTAVAVGPAFGAGGFLIATGHPGGADESAGAQPVVYLFTSDEPGQELPHRGLSSEPVALAFDPDGDALVMAGDDRVRVLRLKAG